MGRRHIRAPVSDLSVLPAVCSVERAGMGSGVDASVATALRDAAALPRSCERGARWLARPALARRSACRPRAGEFSAPRRAAPRPVRRVHLAASATPGGKMAARCASSSAAAGECQPSSQASQSGTPHTTGEVVPPRQRWLPARRRRQRRPIARHHRFHCTAAARLLFAFWRRPAVALRAVRTPPSCTMCRGYRPAS